MSLREEGLRAVFKTKFQQLNIVVEEVIVYNNEIRVYVGEIAVSTDQIIVLKEIMGWSLDDIGAESGSLVFSYV